MYTEDFLWDCEYLIIPGTANREKPVFGVVHKASAPPSPLELGFGWGRKKHCNQVVRVLSMIHTFDAIMFLATTRAQKKFEGWPVLLLQWITICCNQMCALSRKIWRFRENGSPGPRGVQGSTIAFRIALIEFSTKINYFFEKLFFFDDFFCRKIMIFRNFHWFSIDLL